VIDGVVVEDSVVAVVWIIGRSHNCHPYLRTHLIEAAAAVVVERRYHNNQYSNRDGVYQHIDHTAAAAVVGDVDDVV
jgi:sugar diacid utilization regulator